MSESLTDFDTWPTQIASARIPANNNVRRMEILVGPVISATTTAQPLSPNERDIYIIPAGATGSQWGSFLEDEIAIYYEATWTAFTPFPGLRKFVEDEGEDWQFIGDSSGGWSPAGGGGGGTPGGSDKYVQFNDGGAFGGEADFQYDKASNVLAVGNINIAAAGLVATAASSTSNAGLRLPHGAAPTSPANGDVWTTSAGIYVRVNGVTVGPLGTGGGAAARDTVSALAGSGSVAVDFDLGDYFTLGLTGNVSGFTFSNLPGAGKGGSLMIQITQDSTPRTVAWPASFKWASGAAGVVSTGSGVVDLLAITTLDNGTTWNATLANAFS